MSEVKSRPSGPRGRSSNRGGRGGFSSRGGRGGSRQTNGNKPDIAAETPSYEDEGEIGVLKKAYAASINTVKEMFPDWTDEDIAFALQETDGDLAATIERISEGTIFSLVDISLRLSFTEAKFLICRQHFPMGRGKKEDKRSISAQGQRPRGRSY